MATCTSSRPPACAFDSIARVAGSWDVCGCARLCCNVACAASPSIFADGKDVFVLMGTTLYTWDAFFPDQVKVVSITVTDCNIAGSKDQANALKKAAVRGGKFMFTAYQRCVPQNVALLAPHLPPHGVPCDVGADTARMPLCCARRTSTPT